MIKNLNQTPSHSTRSLCRIGLTGGIGAGKSTVLGILRDAGVPVISADEIVHSLYEHDQTLRTDIRTYFGSDCFDADGHINRKHLGIAVFSNPDKRRLLENLTHGKVREKVEQFFCAHQDKPLAVAEIPLLFESADEAFIAQAYDEIWLVTASEETQISRLMQARSLNREEALLRIRNQLPLEQKISRSHVVIENNGSVEALKAQVGSLLQKIL